jgi:cullin-4
MISKLVSECGAAFTAKLEGMFRDISLSQELMTGFKQFQSQLPDFVSNSDSSAVDFFSAHVLTQGVWPPYSDCSSNLVIPNDVALAQSSFQTFYLNKHNGAFFLFFSVSLHNIVR